MRRLLFAAVFLQAGAPALADDAALLLGTERYGALDRVSGASEMVNASEALESVGFNVSLLANGSGETVPAKMDQFLRDAADADRIVVGLAGSFATDGLQTWLLPVDTRDPGLFNLPGAISLTSLFRVMSAAPGQSILVIGSESTSGADFGPLMRAGLGAIDPPQGVTVIYGNVDAAVDLVADIAKPGTDIIGKAQSNRSLQVEGYIPTSLVLVPSNFTPTAPEENEQPTESELAAETALWDGARALDTTDAYRNYLERYPDGQYVEDAEALLLEIATEPNRADRLAEEGLDLSRNARRDIQRDLTILNFDPRGIDGIFGPGTRAAITNWQQENGFSQTSYLTNEQITRLDAQAARRAAELEAEAERARAAKEREDRAFWAETGAAGDEPGYRAYLERFPDGVFSREATERLGEIEETKRQRAAAEDKAAWDTATETNTIQGYRTYLAAFSQGAFVAEAEARLAALQEPEPSNGAAIAAETALGLDGITLRLIEARLAQIGLEPGEVDGGLDEDSRRAIRNFQGDRDLEVTGYLNEETIVRLLADGFRALGGD